MAHTNEVDLVVKVASEKAGGTDGQLVLDSVELEETRDNRERVGIGNDAPQAIERGNKSYNFSTTAYMNSAAARALKRIKRGQAETDAVYIRDDDVFVEKADGMVYNTLNTSSSDDGDTTVEIDADLLGIELLEK